MESTEMAKLFDALSQEIRGYCYYFEMNDTTFAIIDGIGKYQFEMHGEIIETKISRFKPEQNIIYLSFEDKKEFLGLIDFSFDPLLPLDENSAWGSPSSGYVVFANDKLPNGKVVLRRYSTRRGA